MSEVREIRLPSGKSIWVEVEEATLKPASRAAGTKKTDLPEGAEVIGFAEEVRDAMQILKDNIDAMASMAAESLKKHGPDEWAIELNIGFKGKANVIPVILSGEANAGIKITAKWRKQG